MITARAEGPPRQNLRAPFPTGPPHILRPNPNLPHSSTLNADAVALCACDIWLHTAFLFGILGIPGGLLGFPGGTSGKEPASQCRRHKRCGLNPWIRKIPWRWEWQPTPVFLPGEFHGQRSLVGYSSWGRKELDMTVVT